MAVLQRCVFGCESIVATGPNTYDILIDVAIGPVKTRAGSRDLPLLGLAKEANELLAFERTFMIAAKNGDGVAEVLDFFAKHLPEGPWHYPADEITDLPQRLMAAEITREKLYLRLHEELPYQSTVETDSWKGLRNGSVRIEQTIYVERESQRKIVLGEGGRMIKSISMDARKEIEEAVELKVHLFLHVKVREDWGDDPERYRAAGLAFPKD